MTRKIWYVNDALILLEKVISKDIDKPKRNYLINNNCVMRHIKIEIEKRDDNVVAILSDKNQVVLWEDLSYNQRVEILSNLQQTWELLYKHYRD